MSVSEMNEFDFVDFSIELNVSDRELTSQCLHQQLVS
jgi:hypothetical protein